MNTITKTIAGIFGMMCLLTVQNVRAQNYKKIASFAYSNPNDGFTDIFFDVSANIYTNDPKGPVLVKIETKVDVRFTQYSYRENGRIYTLNEIGSAPFANAVISPKMGFEMEVRYDGKTERMYAGNGTINQLVVAEGFNLNSIALSIVDKTPKNQGDAFFNSAVYNAIQKYKESLKQDKETEEKKKKEEEENKKAEASAKEMKKKLGGTINVTSNKTKTDDFWSGGTDKNTASKSDDDFWAGGKEKTKTMAIKPSNSKGVKGYEREEVWESIKMDKNGDEVRWGDYVRFKSNGEWKTEQILNHNNYSSKFIGQYNVIMDPNTTSILLPCSGDVDLKVATSIFSIINRKGEVVMTSNLGDGFGVLGNTHFIINYFGFDRNYRGCSANIIDVRTQKEILKLPTNYYNPNKYTSIRSGFSHSNYFIDSDGVYSGHVNPKMSIFLENVQKEIVSGNFVGCLVYEEDAYKSMINNSITYVNLIFLRDDGSYVEKKGVKMLND
ncbi:hypothetical protein [Empedobacter tilapiae]